MLIKKALSPLMQAYEAMEQAVVGEQSCINNRLFNWNAIFSAGRFAEKTRQLVQPWSTFAFLYETFEIMHQSTPLVRIGATRLLLKN